MATSAVAGCAIGGLSVGEPKPVMAEMLEVVAEILPVEKPRYLIGCWVAGRSLDGCGTGGRSLRLCPARPGCRAQRGVVHSRGHVNIKQRRFADVHEPLDPGVDCNALQQSQRQPISVVYLAEEKSWGSKTSPSIHNLRFLARRVGMIGQAIERNAFASAHDAFLDRYRPVERTLHA